MPHRQAPEHAMGCDYYVEGSLVIPRESRRRQPAFPADQSQVASGNDSCRLCLSLRIVAAVNTMCVQGRAAGSLDYYGWYHRRTRAPRELQTRTAKLHKHLWPTNDIPHRLVAQTPTSGSPDHDMSYSVPASVDHNAKSQLCAALSV